MLAARENAKTAVADSVLLQNNLHANTTLHRVAILGRLGVRQGLLKFHHTLRLVRLSSGFRDQVVGLPCG